MRLLVKQEVIKKLQQRNEFRKEYAKRARYLREHPVEFIEEMYGIKLYWYQKKLIELMGQKNFITMPYRHGRSQLIDIANTIYKIMYK